MNNTHIYHVSSSRSLETMEMNIICACVTRRTQTGFSRFCYPRYSHSLTFSLSLPYNASYGYPRPDYAVRLHHSLRDPHSYVSHPQLIIIG
jgi:hypothetical protein